MPVTPRPTRRPRVFYARHALSTAVVATLATVIAPASADDPLERRPPEDRGVEVVIDAHVVRPTRLEATDERIASLRVPEGFRLEVFARELENPRILCVASDGSIYVSRRENGDVILLRDNDRDGRADERPDGSTFEVVAEKEMAHGLALSPDESRLFVVTDTELFVADRRRDGTLGELQLVIDDFPDAAQHPNRTAKFGPDGRLYVSIGSSSNASDEPNEEAATMLVMNPDGSDRRIFAKGLRNTIGFGWHPQTDEFWGMDHGIDWLGNDANPEELNRIEEGNHYGWPFIHAKGEPTPHRYPPDDLTHEAFAETTTDPVLLYTAHAAPMQMAFYDANAFPAEFRGDAFVAMRGSWNRRPPSGYEIVRVRFDEGRPVSIEPFVTGWLVENPRPEARLATARVGESAQWGSSWAHFGRLCGMAVANDGSLLFTDDTNGVIYRLSHGE